MLTAMLAWRQLISEGGMMATKKERKAAAQMLGKRGGDKRASRLTDARLSEIAREGALAMHRKLGHKIKDLPDSTK